MSDPELIYFNGRGYGEIIRLMLTACGIEFKDSHLKSKEEYLELKPNLSFGQVPLLIVDGKHLVQSGAIVRYIARSHLLYGEDEDEMTLVDACYEGTRDFLKPFMQVGVAYPFDKTVENTEAIVKKFLPLFEVILKKNGGDGHLVGNSLTFADLGLLEVLLYLDDFYEKKIYEPYPELKKFKSNMAELKFYKKYLTKIRKPLHDPDKIAHAREVLGYTQ